MHSLGLTNEHRTSILKMKKFIYVHIYQEKLNHYEINKMPSGNLI